MINPKNYAKEVVEERITFYQDQISFLTKKEAPEQSIETSKKLLNFWTKYKKKHFN